MTWRVCLAAGALSALFSTPVITYGTYRMTLCPRFVDYERFILHRLAADMHGGPPGPADEKDVSLIFHLPIVCTVASLKATVVAVGAVALWSVTRVNHVTRLPMAVLFGGICVYGAVFEFWQALEHLSWGFWIRTAGYAMSGGGMGLGAAGAIGVCMATGRSRRDWTEFFVLSAPDAAHNRLPSDRG